MYSGLLPSGLTYSDTELDSDDDNSSVLINESAKTDDRKDEKTDLLLELPSTRRQSNEINYNDSNECLPGVSLEMWQRFKQLQKQNLEMKNTNRPKERRRRKKKHKKVEETSSSTEPVKEREVQAVREEHWNGLKQYFDINDRFQPPACSRPLPKTGLEKNIDHAIAEGDFEKAEELSDTLAVRELAVKIAKATDCRDFVKTKQEAEASREAQKRKKQVAWGFEAKKRWETKSNMGYM